MPLSWNEMKSRSLAFAKEWEGESSEDAEAKSFWDGFFNIFGISRKRVASFEEPVKKLGDKQGFIDLFWKGVLLVEHKSLGKDLGKAYTQALDYFPGIVERDLPKYVLVSDFARFRLYNLVDSEQHEFELKDLHKNVQMFGFIAGYQTHKIQEQDPVNICAAERMGRLHDLMKDVGYDGHSLELYLVRLLFCVFAEDTGIFERRQFQDYVEQRTGEDGSDLAHHLSTLFQVLNTPADKRLRNLDEQLAAFPYLNGRLFEEMLPTASFDSAMRQSLLDCCALDWSRISPAIFGSLFQSIMDREKRRNLGAHYTSEKNILKLINLLFMDALREEFAKIRGNKSKLSEFHRKLRSLTFLDPACGCGNFLVIAYRELRLLELEVLRASHYSRQQSLDVSSLILLNVDQFHGIEIGEFPAQIAQVALWLIDHQMNLLVSEEFGLYFARIPLRSSANIVCGNALRMDWGRLLTGKTLDVSADVVNVRLAQEESADYETVNVTAQKLNMVNGQPAAKAEKSGGMGFDYIFGNPPFIGKQYQKDGQKADMLLTFEGVDGAGVLDYVACWYHKAAEMAVRNPKTRIAFVSTNSIVQGEQVSVLWNELLRRGVRINFAHRTFQWSNEARGKAAVHCVIIGFGVQDVPVKWIFDYATLKSEPTAAKASRINPYLVDAPECVLENRRKPLCAVPNIVFGSMPNDGGFLILDDEEKMEMLAEDASAGRFVRPFLGAEEFINRKSRWCLWLKDASPGELRNSPPILRRLESVRQYRLKSNRAATRKLAATPSIFGEIRQPEGAYILVPRVSSEHRDFIPMGFMGADVICSDAGMTIPSATLYNFGVLTSTMHNAWMRVVCGRLGSSYRYSAGIVYNNFPWPENPGDKQKEVIESAAQAVLDVRAQFPTASLAELYDPLIMPPPLTKAHQSLDNAVDSAYGRKDFTAEAERVAFLFELYQELTLAI